MKSPELLAELARIEGGGRAPIHGEAIVPPRETPLTDGDAEPPAGRAANESSHAVAHDPS